MVPKEVFLAYSPQFIYLIIRLVPGNVVMVAIDICRKSRITGKWIYGITRKHVSAFMFFVYYLLVCLTIFLHFYICNVWFIVANNRILVLILEPFLFLNFITILLPGNTRKFCKQIFSFYWKWYIWKQSFKDSLWNGYFIYTWGIPVAGSISSRAAGLPLCGSGLLRGCFSIILFIYCLNYCFLGGITLSDCFIILSTLFILTYMEGKLCGERSSRVDFW